MKKYLIKQTKKSISLFLAVLMVLSCWVWVAPEKAEAAKFTPLTQYTVKVKWTVSNTSISGGNIQYKTLGDGWGSESGFETGLNSMSGKTGTGSYEVSWTTVNFPTVVKITTEGNWSTKKARVVVNEISINDKVVYNGSGGVAYDHGRTGGTKSAEAYPDYNASNLGTSGALGGGYSWPRPMLVGFNDDSASASDIAVTLNQIGGQNITKTADYNIAKYTCYNQYGVKIADPTNYINNGRVANLTEQTTYVSGTKNSDDPLTGEDAADIYATANDKDTVVIKPNLQISNPQGSEGSATYYLVRKYVYDDTFGGSITSKVSAKIDVTYPKYTVNFNGGLSTAKIFADKEYTGSYSPQKYNGGTIAVPSKAEAAGYTFYDFWSKPQPATGNASYNAAASVFAEPCTSEDFDSYTKMPGAKVDGDIVTVTEDGTEKSYYNAGVKMDPTTVKTIDVSENKKNFKENWYAYWLAKDLSVKFYDVDGSFLGEKLVKSGQTQADITWPTSKYINSGYTTGAFKFKVDANIWETTAGVEINKNSYTFSEDLILTPKLTRETFKDKYTVTFMNPNGGSVAVGGTVGSYDYRADIKNYADTAKGMIAATPNDVSSDLEFRYELLGWSSVKPTTGNNYHVLLENADFDVNGTAIGLNSDWVVRNDATYYPVYRRFTKTYVVEFHYKDATGADATRQLKFKYGETLVPPTEYVPYSYVAKGFGRTFNKWAYSNADGDATLDYNATIPFTNEYISIEGAALDGTEGLDPIDITATYGAPVATPYTVKFDYIDSKGEETSSDVEVRNEQFILQGTVDNLKPAEKWENEDNLYTYADKWEITEGAATVGVGGAEKKVGDIINTADLITLTPTSNVTFKAVYANPIPYFTVTYIDGDKTFKDRVLQDSNVPEWTNKVNNDNGTPDDTTDDFEEDKIYVPADYEGEGGTYEFQGWFDAATGGNKVTTADKVTSNLTLYSQFKFVPDTFTITFMNHDGSVQLAAGKYEKGQNIEALVTTATKAAQGRAEDNTYKYLFLGWDKAVPTFCEGYDVTYTALYKPVYKYYDVKWYNSKLVDGKWVADKSTSVVEGETVETNLLATTHHTYNSKLYTPSVGNLDCLETAPDGQTYTFAGWYYNDAEGNAVKYERGMTVTAEMEFYATFTLSAKIYTVTTVVKGETARYEVADGKTIEIPDPQAGFVNATKHDAFAGWYTDEAYTTEFVADTEIKADTKIYAKFEVSDHDFSEKELVEAPTYYAVGTMDVWCACDKAKTKKTEAIDMLTDKEIPTGTIYLGGLGKWSSNDEIGGAALDNGEITIYANADTDVIITANDTGDVNALYNPAGLGKGVRVIRAFIYPGKFETLTADSYGAAQSLTVDVYNDDTQAQTNNANFAVKLGDFVVADLDEDGKPQYDENGKVKYKDLASGESYIVYYYVVDKAGNQLRQKVRTAKFIYDDTKPAFTVEGESNKAAVPTYCGTATVTGVEADAVLTVNGTEVIAINGEYVINYAEGMDNVVITATDKAGNTFTKKIKVADHSYITTEQAASCGVAGYKKVECIICGDVKSEETYAALDHIYSIREVIPADCVNIGSIVVTCEICGDKVTTQYEEDGVTPVIPAEGHEYAEDADGNIIYTTVTASTCKTKGLAEAICTVCGEGKTTKVLDLNPDNHEDITITNVEADCVNGGSYKKACSCGVIIEEATYPAKGHGTIDEGTAEWYVRTAPTCYQTGEKVLKCLVCSNFIEVEGKEVTEEIEATGEHVKTVTNPETYKEDGAVKYHCATPGCTFKYDDKPYVDDSLKEYTVTFKDEAGNIIKTFTQLEGTAIAKEAVTAPEKANSKDGKFKYAFAGWTDGTNKYKLPLTVTGNLTLKAAYKESKILYTHKFVIPAYDAATGKFDANNPTEYRTLLGALGEERVPSGTPVIDVKGTDSTFQFDGWKTIQGEEPKDFIINGEDKVFVATFNENVAVYEVIFYSEYDYVWNTTVESGKKVTFGGTEPTKNYDTEYHYTFKGWYLDPACTDKDKFDFNDPITGKTRLYAGYTDIAHTMVVDEKDGRNEASTCAKAGKEVLKCTGCDYEEVNDTEILEHVYVKVENGKKCELCGDFVEDEAVKFTVKFVNGTNIIGRYTVVEGGKLPDDITFNPTKAEDAQYVYTFNGNWKYNNKEYTLAEILAMEIDSHYTFEACYDKETKSYKVSYRDDNDNIIKTQMVKYGQALYAFDGANPTRERDDQYHYTFSGWDKQAGVYVIKEDTIVTPQFDKEKHEFGEKFTTEATCTEPGSQVEACKCGYKKIIVSTIPALGHTDINETTGEKVQHTIVAPTHKADGSDSYICQRCSVKVTKKIDKLPSTTITIVVKDANGKLAVDGAAKVTITNKNNPNDVHFDFTDMDGKVVFTVAAGQEWTVAITGKTLPQGGYGFELGKGETSFEASPDMEVEDDDDIDCSCTCHKGTFWGIIFRLFQKFLALFRGGKIKCCSDPSELYK